MDDTQQSRASDAAATRKRRSSILKNQRPARTPFSELEFNVATPTDTAKSRRVSFSRRTGVAEFATNEATTTWKNFYEEHNKSLESSGNDSEAHASRQPVQHLGRRIFDQQFEDFEAVDCVSNLNPPNASINFSQAIEAVELTTDGKVTAPNNKFNLSMLSDQQSKLFGNDFTMTGGGLSNKIDFNFSNIQQLDERNGINEIEIDLNGAKLVCRGPTDSHNISEYIEVDLNTTQVAKGDCDMSITDTVSSPKVQEVSKSISKDKKVNLEKDWTTDKENIAINPYVAQREEDNFAMNDEPDHVLVFDGKRLTLQSNNSEIEKQKAPLAKETRKTIILNTNDDLPNFKDEVSLRADNDVPQDAPELLFKAVHRVNVTKKKTIHDNSSNMSITQGITSQCLLDQKAVKRKTIVFDDDKANISITQAIPSQLILDHEVSEKRKTIVFDKSGNLSITQALPANIVFETQEKRKTIIYEDNTGYLSITQAAPNNLLLPGKSDRRRTVVYDDESGNISVTQPLSPNIILGKIDQGKDNQYSDADISMTQALPTNIIVKDSGKNKNMMRTIVYDDDTGNISITQAIPAKLISGTESRENIHTSNDNFESANTITEPGNKDLTRNNTKENATTSILYDDDAGNVSITQALPGKFLSGIESTLNALITNSVTSISSTIITTEMVDKRRISETVSPENLLPFKEETHLKLLDNPTSTINKDQIPETRITADVSANYKDVQTKYVKQIESEIDNTIVPEDIILHSSSSSRDINEHKTRLYDDDDIDDISMTQAIPSNIIIFKQEQTEIEHIRKERINDGDDIRDSSSTERVPANIFLLSGMKSSSNETFQDLSVIKEAVNKEISKHFERNDSDLERRRTLILADENCETEMSITEAMPQIQMLNNSLKKINTDDWNLSLKKPIPDQLIEIQTVKLNSSIVKEAELYDTANVTDQTKNVLVYQAVTNNTLIANKMDEEDLKTQDARPNCETNISKDIENLESHTSIEATNAVILIDNNITVAPLTDMNEMKVPDDNLKTSNSSDQSLDKEKPSKTSVLNDLLDMTEPVNSDTLNTPLDNEPVSADLEKTSTRESSLNYAVMEQDAEMQTERIPFEIDEPSTEKGSVDTPFEDKEKYERVQNELNDFSDKIITPITSDTDNRNEEITRFKSVKDANSTRELLDMLSEFTDNSRCESIDSRPSEASEKKSSAPELRRQSSLMGRQSIVISREDFLSNMSMAQAILQKSRVELNDSNITDDNQDSSPDDYTSLSKLSSRMSNDVVKTLQFEDSIRESSLKTNSSTLTPLKKVAFGEISVANNTTKTKVIPGYLKDVSDGIKQLMSELVKPITDAMPFDTIDDCRVKKVVSTASTQIQTNMKSSSQIDLGTELCSSAEAGESIQYTTRSGRTEVIDTAKSSVNGSELDLIHDLSYQPRHPPCLQSDGPSVLVFDHENPLNNVLLGPFVFTGTHNYKPLPSENLVKGSDETLCGSEHSQFCQTSIETDVDSVDADSIDHSSKKVQVNSEPVVTQYCTTVHNPLANRHIDRPVYIDKAVLAQSEVKRTEVNTLIVMKPNNVLLGTGSSLTIMDDSSISHSGSMSSKYFIIKKKDRKSITKPNVDESSDITTDDDIERCKSKGKKRSHIPGTPNKKTDVDLTSKPINKMLKITDSQNPNRLLLRMSHDSSKVPAERDIEVTYDDKSKSNTQCSNITVNKEMLDILEDPDYFTGVSGNSNPKSGSGNSPKSSTGNSPKFGSLQSPKSGSVYSDVYKVPSFASSNNQNLPCLKHMRIMNATDSNKSQSTIESADCARIEWHPELSSLAANRNVSYMDSGVNIVSKIDMLPFMGSYECERESSLTDTWSFRLLHGRIRLMVRLAHRHDNSARTRVRADTPVTEVSIDTIDYDKKNPVALLCIRFACETMRYMVSYPTDTSCLARDVPLLLRRCAAVARVALRWGRAMHDAKLHLAYTLSTDGHLTVKVANIALRSVWEVRMDMELVVEHSGQAPWPRAGNVRVDRVVSDVTISDDDIRKVLKHIPNDWGHVPKTLWRIFRYLKNKQCDDDDELLMLT